MRTEHNKGLHTTTSQIPLQNAQITKSNKNAAAPKVWWVTLHTNTAVRLFESRLETLHTVTFVSRHGIRAKVSARRFLCTLIYIYKYVSSNSFQYVSHTQTVTRNGRIDSVSIFTLTIVRSRRIFTDLRTESLVITFVFVWKDFSSIQAKPRKKIINFQKLHRGAQNKANYKERGRNFVTRKHTETTSAGSQQVTRIAIASISSVLVQTDLVAWRRYTGALVNINADSSSIP